MATDASKSYPCQVFRNYYFSLYQGIKENLSEVVPKFEAAGILIPSAPGAQEGQKEKSCDQDERAVAILNAIEEKLSDLDFFWRLVGILRSLPVLAHLAGMLEEGFWKSGEDLVEDMPTKMPNKATPTKTPDRATPTNVSDRATPTNVSEGAMPTKVPEGAMPTKVPEGDEGDRPTKTPDRATPTKVSEEAMPTKVTEGDEGDIPTKTPDRATATKVSEGATPTKVPEGNEGDISTKTPDRATPTKVSEEAMPTKVPEEDEGDISTKMPDEVTPTDDTQEESKTESEYTSIFLSPTEHGNLGNPSDEIVLPKFSVKPSGETEMPELAKSFPSVVSGASFGAAVSGNFTESQLETADDRSGENVEQREVLVREQVVNVPLRRNRMNVSNSEGADEELVHLNSLERAVGKMVSGYVLGEKAKLEADYEEKCETIRAECKQELDAMSEYYQNVEEELKLADSAHAAEIKYLKRTHEEEKKDLISTRQLQAKIKDAELEQKERELKALQEEYKRKVEEVLKMEARLETMKEEVEVMAKKVWEKEEGVSELRKWRSLQLQRKKEEVKNKMTTCKEIGELISQWFEGNRDEAIKKQIEGKIQDIKSKRRGSKTM